MRQNRNPRDLVRSATLLVVTWVVFFDTTGAMFADPRDLPGNVLWLDANDVDGDFVAGGEFVEGTTWRDKSTSQNAHFVQSSESNRPQLVTRDGRTLLRFDGNDFLDAESTALGMLNGVEGATLFGLVSADSTSERGQRLLMVSTGSGSGQTRAGINLFDTFGTSIGGRGDFGAAGRRLDDDSFQRIEGGTKLLGALQQFGAAFNYASGRLNLFSESEVLHSSGEFQSPGATSATDSTNIRIGADADLCDCRGFFQGEIAEVVVYDRVLSESEIALVNAYLHEKWSSSPRLFVRGDCNDDGTVDISDAVFSPGSLFLGDGDPGCDDACDSNDDGARDISDAIETLGVLFLGNGEIPLPGMTECGVDPTEDAVGCGEYNGCP